MALHPRQVSLNSALAADRVGNHALAAQHYRAVLSFLQPQEQHLREDGMPLAEDVATLLFEVHYRIGKSCEYMRKLGMAARHLQAACVCSLHPVSGCVAGCKVARIFHVPALASLACVQAKLGDMRAALRSIGLAISHDDINSDLVFVRAMLLRSIGRVREAVRDLSAALKRDRDNLPCRFLRALCLEELEQAEEDGAAGDSPADDTAAAGLSSSKDMRRAQQRDPMITDYASIDFNSPLFDPFFRRFLHLRVPHIVQRIPAALLEDPPASPQRPSLRAQPPSSPGVPAAPLDAALAPAPDVGVVRGAKSPLHNRPAAMLALPAPSSAADEPDQEGSRSTAAAAKQSAGPRRTAGSKPVQPRRNYDKPWLVTRQPKKKTARPSADGAHAQPGNTGANPHLRTRPKKPQNVPRPYPKPWLDHVRHPTSKSRDRDADEIPDRSGGSGRARQQRGQLSASPMYDHLTVPFRSISARPQVVHMNPSSLAFTMESAAPPTSPRVTVPVMSRTMPLQRKVPVKADPAVQSPQYRARVWAANNLTLQSHSALHQLHTTQ